MGSETLWKMLKTNSVFQKVKRFDSTMVTISSSLVDWGMRVGKPLKKGLPKVQLKFTMELHAKLPASVKSFFHQDRLSEERELKQAIEEAKLDKGQRLIFITNIWDLNAMQIVRIYRQR